ncbi:MAG TPA: TIGR01906 family membrane protein [Longilinea sp.]|nr:TIGR01906 family membrane protein [Longilinea sp.]
MTKIGLFILSVSIPFFLLMTAIRVLLTPVFVNVEYFMPGFPVDEYGFTRADRLMYAPLAVEYLVNSAGIEFLGDQTFPDGSSLYNERELSHMLDVKILVQKMITAWMIIGAILIAAGVWAWRGRWWQAYTLAWGRGACYTVGLIGLIIAAVTINFDALFTTFHHIFFTGDSWLFYYSDTLIRLFPIRFWSDAFIVVGGFSLLAAGLIIWAVYRKKK